jgi:hypothetical protein
VLAAQHLLHFARLDEAGERLDAFRQLRLDVLALPGPVDEHAKVVGFRLQRGNQLDVFLDAAAPLEDFLRFDLVVPEAGLRSPGFYLRELVGWAWGLKDSSGDRRSALQGPDIVGSAHRER